MFTAVLFDLDGVLTDTAEYHYLAWKKLADELGIPLTRADNEHLKGVSREDSLRFILTLAAEPISLTAAEFKQLAAKKNDYYVTMIEAVSPADCFPGIATLLQTLKEHHVKIGLASASKNGPTLLKKLGLASYFDTIVDPAVLAKGKPDPEIFLRAAQQLNVDPTTTIGIEDAPAGIRAIKASGALPIGVGQAASLGSDIALVPSTETLTFDFLVTTWKNQATTATNKNS